MDSNAKQESKKEESAWETWAKEKGVFVGSLIFFGLILAGASFFIYIGVGSHLIFNNAKYKVNADCRVVSVEEYEKEQYVYDDYYKDYPPAEREKHKKLEKYKLYVIEWEYYIDDIRHTFKTTDKYMTVHKVGDTGNQQLYSDDGVEYKKAPFNGLSDFLLGTCVIVACLCVYLIIGIIVTRINIVSKRKKNKNKN
jgi:hypothetical protein